VKPACRHEGQPVGDIDLEQWLPLVKWVMGRLPGHVYRRLDRDDIYQAGVIGLLNAKRCFRPDRGASFKTYSVSKIRWSIYIAAGLTRRGWERRPVRLRDEDA
jgi:RNA polymerase sigma factor for flagellar operon FliA